MIPANSVGIFGGSFNPVHVGHLKLAEEIQKRCAFKPLWIVPNQNPPHKEAYEVPREKRLEMVKLAFAGVPGAQVSTYEMDAEGTNYAIRTIEYFRRQHMDASGVAPLYFILGADAFHDLPHWYAFPDVMEACSYVVVVRAGWDSEDHSKLATRLEKLVAARLLTAEDASEPFDRAYRTRSGTRVGILKLSLPEVSSTEIRLRAQFGQPLDGYVPPAVAAYLKANKIYGNSEI